MVNSNADALGIIFPNSSRTAMTLWYPSWQPSA